MYVFANGFGKISIYVIMAEIPEAVYIVFFESGNYRFADALGNAEYGGDGLIQLAE